MQKAKQCGNEDAKIADVPRQMMTNTTAYFMKNVYKKILIINNQKKKIIKQKETNKN